MELGRVGVRWAALVGARRAGKIGDVEMIGGLLLTYRQPDPTRRLPSISRSLPDSWIESHLAGQTRELFREY